MIITEKNTPTITEQKQTFKAYIYKLIKADRKEVRHE